MVGTFFSGFGLRFMLEFLLTALVAGDFVSIWINNRKALARDNKEFAFWFWFLFYITSGSSSPVCQSHRVNGADVSFPAKASTEDDHEWGLISDNLLKNIDLIENGKFVCWCKSVGAGICIIFSYWSLSVLCIWVNTCRFHRQLQCCWSCGLSTTRSSVMSDDCDHKWNWVFWHILVLTISIEYYTHLFLFILLAKRIWSVNIRKLTYDSIHLIIFDLFTFDQRWISCLPRCQFFNDLVSCGWARLASCRL